MTEGLGVGSIVGDGAGRSGRIVRRATLADQVAEEIVSMVRENNLEPGASIPSEGELAQTFGVNRLVVREAIRTLTAREILVSSQGKTARVCATSGTVLAQIFDFYLHQHSVDPEDLVLTRRSVEGELAARAAARVRSGEGVDLAKAESALSVMQEAEGEIGRFIKADLDFHESIAESSGAKLLVLILNSLERLLLEGRRASFEARERRGEGHASTVRAHRRILEAIRDGTEDEARQAMYAHLDETRHDLEETAR